MRFDAAYGLALVEIVWINLLLSGDNALVIALASRSLPRGMQKWGVILGTVPAVALRILFTAIITWVLSVPFVKIAGGGLLIWIAFGLLQPCHGKEAVQSKRAAGVWAAARTIVVADAVMSLDNVVAIAAAARGDMSLLVIGLLISMPLVICGAALLVKLLTRFPVLVTGGSCLLGFIAGQLIVADRSVQYWLGPPSDLVAYALPAAVAAWLAGAGWLLHTHRPRPAEPAYIPQRQDAA